MKKVYEMKAAEGFKMNGKIYIATEMYSTNWDGDTKYMCVDVVTKKTGMD